MRRIMTKAMLGGMLSLGIMAMPAAAQVYFKTPITGTGSFNFTVPPGSYKGFGYTGKQLPGTTFSVQDNGGGNYTATFENFKPDTNLHILYTGGKYSLNGGPLSPGVPEPAVWISMLLGFGGIGTALRLRQRPIAPAVSS